MTMRAIFTAAAVTIIAGVAVTPAGASERLRDGATGAAAGAVVGGPVGLVAGGVVGYTAGPKIARHIHPRNRRVHEDDYRDGAAEGHRSANR
jgi:hypothetical protein